MGNSWRRGKDGEKMEKRKSLPYMGDLVAMVDYRKVSPKLGYTSPAGAAFTMPAMPPRSAMKETNWRCSEFGQLQRVHWEMGP